MFSIRQTATAGLGIFATKPIPRGSRILSEKALISIPSDAPQSSILSAANALLPKARDSLLSLSRNETKHISWLNRLQSLWLSKFSPLAYKTNHSILNIFRNNNFSINASTRALFPQVARLNHSCLPNAQGNFNSFLEKFTVHATRDIKVDEEITISYLKDQGAVREVRRGLLREGYGFECACDACCAVKGKVGEERRVELRRRVEEFGKRVVEEGPDDVGELELMRYMLGAFEEEGIRGREIATMYVAAAKMAVKLGQEALAKDLAAKGLVLEEEAVGSDSPLFVETAKEVRGLSVS